MRRSIPLLFATLLLPACGSTPPQHAAQPQAEVESDGATVAEATFTFVHADAARTANLVRGFFDGASPTIAVVDGRTWQVRGTPEELRLVRLAHTSLDQPDVAADLVPSTYVFEDRDARLLANSARAELAGREDWVILCPDPDHWYTLVPSDDLEALEELVARLRADV